jgi:hypothetical protein
MGVPLRISRDFQQKIYPSIGNECVSDAFNDSCPLAALLHKQYEIGVKYHRLRSPTLVSPIAAKWKSKSEELSKSSSQIIYATKPLCSKVSLSEVSD